MKDHFFLRSLILLFLISGCTGRHDGVVNFHVEKADYLENLSVIGTVQPVKSNVIKTPPVGIVNVAYISDEGSFVHKGDTVCILASPDLQTMVDDFTQRLTGLKADKDKLEADNALKLSLLEAKIENNNIQVELNSLDSVQRQFAPPLQQKLIDLKREQAAILKRKLERNYQAQKSISEAEIRSLGFRIKQLEGRLQRFQSMLDMLIVLAPADGMVMHTSAPTIQFMSSSGAGSIGGYIMQGSSVYSGMPLLEMPEMGEMQVSVDLPENEYKRVESGQLVHVRVDASSHLYTTGKVSRKLLSGTMANSNSRVKFYEVIIGVDSCHAQMTPGLSANCEIVVQEVKDTLVVPAVALFGESNERFVYVAEGNKYVKRSVETGLINSSSAIVKSGLKQGEVIALAEPLPGMILKQKSKQQDDEAGLPADSLAAGTDSVATGYRPEPRTIENETP